MEGQPPGSQASGPCSEKVSAHVETSHHNSLIVTRSVIMAIIITVAIVVSIVIVFVGNNSSIKRETFPVQTGG